MSDDWKTAKLPTLYVKATKAIIECATIDECLEWKNKMNAAASYAKQINDRTLFENAVVIRNRARRRMGEILSGQDRKRGANQNIREARLPKVGRAAFANSHGISEHERKTSLRIAALPKEEFNRREKDPMLGQSKSKPSADVTFITCPHCGGKIWR